MLPPDLRTAEAEALEALRAALAADAKGRWTLELRFEGLRLMPVVLRLGAALKADELPFRLLFADAGATALARRDGPELADHIASFSDQRRRQQAEPIAGSTAGPTAEPTNQAPLLLLVGASQAEYEEVETLCEGYQGPVVLINASLEDAAVGIGSVARQRRRGFLSLWSAAYALIPRPASALRRCYPHDWELYRLDPDGYRAVARFDHRPDGEEQDAALETEGGNGLAGTLRSVDRLLEGLQN
ncbi:MAG: DUF1995 family protein [Cyanobium sp. ELA507]